MRPSRKGKGEGKSGARGKGKGSFTFPRAPDFPSPFPFLAPATQATEIGAGSILVHGPRSMFYTRPEVQARAADGLVGGYSPFTAQAM